MGMLRFFKKVQYGIANHFCLIATVALLCCLHALPVQAQRTFKDDLGRKILLPLIPTRIVSLAPNITEILYALQLGHRIVGITTFSDYPKEAVEKPKVGSYVHLNIEKIVALRPDLIIGTYGGNPKATVLRLEQLGFPVYVSRTKTIEDMLGMIAEIGTITNTRERADALVSQLRKRIKTVADRVQHVPRPLVFIELNAEPLMTAGGASFHNEVIALAGGRNLAADSLTRYPQYSLEDVIKKGPDVILISTMARSHLFEQRTARPYPHRLLGHAGGHRSIAQRAGLPRQRGPLREVTH